MKKALTLLLAAALSGLASALTVEWSDYNWTTVALPASTSTSLTNLGSDANNWQTVLASKDAGIYMGQKGGGNISNWGTPTTGSAVEGQWVNTANTGSAGLAYRNGVGGDFVGIVLGGMVSSPTDAVHYTFSLNLPNANNADRSGQVYVGVVHGGTTTWVNDTTSYTIAAGATTLDVTETLDLSSIFGEDGTWAADDKLIFGIAGIQQSGRSNTEVYTIENITLSLGEEIPPTPPTPVDPETPEPTVLALLAIGVAGLALRRKQA
ncbi:MAG: PEP-CTERM sorting domain-containing protein [Candidatus Spyradenecus sp.]